MVSQNNTPGSADVTNGAILVDGIDIRDLKLDSLRNHIGIVQQDVYLFAGTIMDNIRYGRPDATDEDVIKAAKYANAHEFIMSFPGIITADLLLTLGPAQSDDPYMTESCHGETRFLQIP